jgi:hypothetical protein
MIGLGATSGVLAGMKKIKIGQQTSSPNKIVSHNFRGYYDPHMPDRPKLIFKEDRSQMLVKFKGEDWRYAITLNNMFKLLGMNKWYAKRELTKKMNQETPKTK